MLNILKGAGRKAVAAPLLVAVFVMASASMAAAQTATETAVTNAASGLDTEVTAIALAVLPFAASIAAITIGWRMVRRFVR